MKVFYTILAIFLFGSVYAQNSKLSVLFAGDIMGHDSQIESARDGNSYNYDTCFSLIKPIIENADIAIANLEVTLAGQPYKGYPQFSSPDNLAQSVADAGFDILITANNHALDRSKNGLERGLSILDQKNIIHTGTFKNENIRAKTYPLILEKNNIRLAILNYTYGTNGLKVKEPNIVNYIDTTIIKADLLKAEIADPDFTIVTIHWGLEYQRTENKKQENLARFILHNGADAIIGSHPHVVQPIKTYQIDEQNKLVVYSLGNFISNQRKRYSDGGIIFELELTKDETSTSISNFKYQSVWVYKPEKKTGGNFFMLIPSNYDRYYYDSIGMSEENFVKMKVFQDDTSEHLKNVKSF